MRQGDKVLVRHRFFDWYGWRVEWIPGILRRVDTLRDGTLYSSIDADSGAGYDCWSKDNGRTWNHGI